MDLPSGGNGVEQVRKGGGVVGRVGQVRSIQTTWERRGDERQKLLATYHRQTSIQQGFLLQKGCWNDSNRQCLLSSASNVTHCWPPSSFASLCALAEGEVSSAGV